MTAAHTDQLPAPGLLRRLAAIVYDTFLVLPLIMLVVALAMGAQTLLAGPIDSNPLSPWLVRVLALLTCIGFFAAFWLKGGQTLGMQAWRIRLVSLRGNDVTAGQAALRCVAAALSAACLGAGYWWCLIDRQGRCWHDHLSATRLELLPKRRRGAQTSGAPQ